MQEYDFLPKERAMVLEETNSKESLTALQMLESRMAILVKRVVELVSTIFKDRICINQDCFGKKSVHLFYVQPLRPVKLRQ